jgi:hypothetical protein
MYKTSLQFKPTQQNKTELQTNYDSVPAPAPLEGPEIVLNPGSSPSSRSTRNRGLPGGHGRPHVHIPGRHGRTHVHIPGVQVCADGRMIGCAIYKVSTEGRTSIDQVCTDSRVSLRDIPGRNGRPNVHQEATDGRMSRDLPGLHGRADVPHPSPPRTAARRTAGRPAIYQVSTDGRTSSSKVQQLLGCAAMSQYVCAMAASRAQTTNERSPRHSPRFRPPFRE